MVINESSLAPRSKEARSSSCSAASVPVAVSLDGLPGRLRLRITEDACTYGVMAEFDGICADTFEVELMDREVYIFVCKRLSGGPLPAPLAALDPSYPKLEQGSVALAFGQAIDAAASYGECGHGLLRLSLRKSMPGLETRAVSESGAVLTVAH